MLKSQKHVFWQALIVAAFIFASGILLGFLIENFRTEKMQDLYLEAEIQLLDVKMQNEIFSVREEIGEIGCDLLIQKNIEFADKIFEEALSLNKLEKSQKITENVKTQHKKYDLLRAMVWLNSIETRGKCNYSYHDIIYIYDYNNPRLDQNAKQMSFSRILTELKNRQGNKILLVPIAGDNDLSSIDLLMNAYNVTVDELPVILIDEKIKITEIEKVEKIEELL